jgi:hypothetical protein
MSFLRRLFNIKIILVIFIILGITYSIVTPIFEASDELWHYPLAQWLSKGHPLPVQDPHRIGPWKQEASQPPLYYYLMGWATFWIDTSDMVEVLRPNPHVNNGVVTPDGNINLVIHDPEREAFPWRGTVLAVHIVRFLSVLMGAATVWLTYRIALELFPKQEWFALSAAAVNAFTPMFIFISAAVNNDNLTMTLCSAALLLMIKRARAPLEPATEGFRAGRWIPLGIVLGLAAITKTSALGLLPLAALTAAIVAWKQDQNRLKEFLAGGFATAIPVLLIAGWWYVRNIQLYGDVTGLNAFIEVLGRRAAPASLAQLWGERWGFMLSYWGLFGGVNVQMADGVYHLLNALAWLAFLGVMAYLARLIWTWFRSDPIHSWAGFLHDLKNFIIGRWPLFLLGLWGVVVVAALTQWARVTWSSQGRLVFSAIATWSIYFVLGLTGLLADRLGRWVGAALGITMLGIAILAPFTTIAPAYARSEPSTAVTPSLSLDATFGARIKLLGADVASRSAQPGGSVELVLYWQSVARTDHDFSTFVHLLDENDIVVAQRDMFPGQGLWPTSQMNAGDVIASRYVLDIDDTAYAPSELMWEVGVYDFASRARLTLEDGRDNLRFGLVHLARPASPIPNPVAYNLGDQIELIGYDMDRRALAANDTLHLTLYWRARDVMPVEYSVFTHVLEPPERIWGQDDQFLSPPTTTWAVGQVVSQTYALHIDPATPAGVYEVEIGVYELATFDRLRIVTDDGRITENFIKLNKVRVR